MRLRRRQSHQAPQTPQGFPPTSRQEEEGEDEGGEEKCQGKQPAGSSPRRNGIPSPTFPAGGVFFPDRKQRRTRPASGFQAKGGSATCKEGEARAAAEKEGRQGAARAPFFAGEGACARTGETCPAFLVFWRTLHAETPSGFPPLHPVQAGPKGQPKPEGGGVSSSPPRSAKEATLDVLRPSNGFKYSKDDRGVRSRHE